MTSLGYTVKIWNPRTGESKRVRSREKYEELVEDNGWEVLEWPKSDQKY